MFTHIFKNRLKILLKNKFMIFWTLIFPLVLATFFHLAFAGLSQDEAFAPVRIAVIDNPSYQAEEGFVSLIKETSKKNKNQVFNTTYVKNQAEAKMLLEENKIAGYYLVEEKIDIVVKKSGMDQTIMKYVVDNYYQTSSIVQNIYKFNPAAFKESLITDIDKDGNYFKDASQSNVDVTVIYFYTLIGMVCLYGGFFGIYAVKDTEANLSTRAARITIAPTHKMKNLFISLLAGLIVQYTENLILFAYLIFGLGIAFGSQVPYILLLMLLGTIAGITMGMLIGVSNRKGDGAKTGILLAVTMTCSFLAGMMMVQMKYIVAAYAPLLAKINPVSMITDALYSLYYYTTLDRYLYNCMSLLLFSIVMLGCSYIFIRRKKYDSI